MVWLGAVDIDIPEDVRPWAASREERVRREQHAALLVGDAIVAVRYFDVATAAPPRYGDGFDSVGHGVELDTRSGHTFSATWAIDREHVGLSFRREALRPRWLSAHTHFAVWDVTAHRRWAELIGRRVADVRLWWWEQKPPGEADGCHSVSVRAGARTVHLVLGEEGPDGRLAVQDDNVAVVFEETLARDAQVGPWMPADWPG